MVYILIAILIFGVLIAVHELGHFLAAKLCGVQVNEFSIGMGPAVWHRKKGETAYSFRILPIGAFVELAPGKDGMIHISKLANHRVEKVEDVVKIGDTLEVKVAEIDAQGRVNLVRNDITYDNTAAAAPRRAEGFRARPPRRDGRN